ncbi:hypothetical protein MKK75_23105 [Methylobacterium sp. J-030]|uniref:hypothetical protein n=1 Tax=Methylobacterium sp. J-030 TaxID=2836627 RepID=UPI001FB95F7A|nr:hypothetical protein [Methylobacterium sp. J-030]MCJ2071653.1 hypothetical protein [Methylobacterium sp. J-030]
MARLPALLGLAGFLLIPRTASAADLGAVEPRDGFRATCEDLGTFCFADACGRDQIEAAQNCQSRCPSAAIMSVIPDACRRPEGRPITVLQRRG